MRSPIEHIDAAAALAATPAPDVVDVLRVALAEIGFDLARDEIAAWTDRERAAAAAYAEAYFLADAGIEIDVPARPRTLARGAGSIGARSPR